MEEPSCNSCFLETVVILPRRTCFVVCHDRFVAHFCFSDMCQSSSCSLSSCGCSVEQTGSYPFPCRHYLLATLSRTSPISCISSMDFVLFDPLSMPLLRAHPTQRIPHQQSLMPAVVRLLETLASPPNRRPPVSAAFQGKASHVLSSTKHAVPPLLVLTCCSAKRGMGSMVPIRRLACIRRLEPLPDECRI